MEPNNIENQFRNQLNEREIKPSENAWDRLDAMLTVAEKPKRSYGWLYIAASFLGFLLVATVFFSQTEEVIDVPRKEMVHENTPGEKENTVVPSAKEQQKTDADVVSQKGTAVAVEQKQSKHNTSSIKTVTKEALPVIASENNQNQIAAHSIINQATEQKVAQKPAYINVDELLASVDKPGKPGKIFNQKSGVKVNPNTLLSRVDGELELTFREKVLNTVNKNYNTVKVVLSNRNNQ